VGSEKPLESGVRIEMQDCADVRKQGFQLEEHALEVRRGFEACAADGTIRIGWIVDIAKVDFLQAVLHPQDIEYRQVLHHVAEEARVLLKVIDAEHTALFEHTNRRAREHARRQQGSPQDLPGLPCAAQGLAQPAWCLPNALNDSAAKGQRVFSFLDRKGRFRLAFMPCPLPYPLPGMSAPLLLPTTRILTALEELCMPLPAPYPGR
jgi:hypothetical protein